MPGPFPQHADSDEPFGEKRQIWAPWRYEYVAAPDSPGCFLCHHGEHADQDVAHLVIGRGRRCYALLNRYPYNAGHIMITPYRHVDDLLALETDEHHEILDLIVHARRALALAMRPHGYNLGANLGKAAGAAVDDHLHWHIVPRWIGDTNFMPVLAGTDCIPQALADTAALLRQAWQEVASA